MTPSRHSTGHDEPSPTSRCYEAAAGGRIHRCSDHKLMEPRRDETQDRDCERSQPVSRPAGYGCDGDRGDRDEPIELACRWHCSRCCAPAAEETRDQRTSVAESVEALAGG